MFTITEVLCYTHIEIGRQRETERKRERVLGLYTMSSIQLIKGGAHISSISGMVWLHAHLPAGVYHLPLQGRVAEMHYFKIYILRLCHSACNWQLCLLLGRAGGMVYTLQLSPPPIIPSRIEAGPSMARTSNLAFTEC